LEKDVYGVKRIKWIGNVDVMQDKSRKMREIL
jgi:hypothetical protein